MKWIELQTMEDDEELKAWLKEVEEVMNRKKMPRLVMKLNVMSLNIFKSVVDDSVKIVINFPYGTEADKPLANNAGEDGQ